MVEGRIGTIHSNCKSMDLKSSTERITAAYCLVHLQKIRLSKMY